MGRESQFHDGLGQHDGRSGTSNDPFLCVLTSNGDLRQTILLDQGRVAQRRRRANILATARHMVAQKGREGFVLKEVAETCGVSVQTIYNLIGDRSSVLATAVNDYVVASFDYATGSEAYPNVFLGLAEMFGRSALVAPDYIREASIGYFSGDQEYRQMIRAGAMRIYSDALVRMKRSGELRQSTEIQPLAYRFTCLAAVMVFDWAIGVRTQREMNDDLVASYAGLLREALVPASAERVQRWIDERSKAGMADAHRTQGQNT